jgi:hypothetical protein
MFDRPGAASGESTIMKISRITFAAFPLLFVASLNAQLTHTWVSSTGNDSTCNGIPAKPCATFSQAMSLTVAGGIVSVLGPGDYGPINITQSVTIDGTGGGSIIFGLHNIGVALSLATPATVVLRNLTIDGGGVGEDAIIIGSTVATRVVNVVIDGCRLEGFVGIGVSLGSESPTYLTIKNTTIQGGAFGVRVNEDGTVAPVTAFSHVSLDHVTIQGATEDGVFAANGNLDISNSNITENAATSAATGIVAEDYATVNVQSTMITSNAYGVCINTNSTAIIGTSTVVADNGTNNANCGGSVQGMGGAGPSPKL